MTAACTVCDARIDPHGRDGTRCDRCKQPCRTCGGDVAHCHHPLRPIALGVPPIPTHYLHHLLEGAPI